VQPLVGDPTFVDRPRQGERSRQPVVSWDEPLERRSWPTAVARANRCGQAPDARLMAAAPVARRVIPWGVDEAAPVGRDRPDVHAATHDDHDAPAAGGAGPQRGADVVRDRDRGAQTSALEPPT